jgi:hypothetical protein
MRRLLVLALAVLLAAAGVFLLLLAVDVHRWQTRIATGDVNYRTDPVHRALWTPSQILPGAPARSLLGVDDDLADREALQALKLGRPRVISYAASPRDLAARAAAQALLSRAAELDHDPARRGQQLNLLGVVELIAVGTANRQDQQRFLPQAIDTFREAIAVDPRAHDARYNLELALRMVKKRRQSGGESQNGRGGIAARGRGSGTGY